MYLTPLQALLSILITLLYLNALGIEALPVPASLPTGYDVQTISARSPCKVNDISWCPSKFTHPQPEASITSAMLARTGGIEPAFVARDEQSGPPSSQQAHRHHYTVASLNSYFAKYNAWRKKAATSPTISERGLALEELEDMV
ncbi:hypothetical protein GALMADRAFT_253934 [Galerina marginata CBS 339.88]|uniref:Uncharacterized protein n=1 Tax=Galerina marginata (strain CBS 339.88) TaxID=685588 RepID=A0A067SKW8_GALM3|nr:hypothetical protein GALMADRAFT_253934 [Galerina marginata CBS 339.88]